MNSLIYLQGFALGGGAFPDFDRLASMGWTAIGIIGLAATVGFTLKAVWPKDKW